MNGSTTVLQPWANPCAPLLELSNRLYGILSGLENRKRARKAEDEVAYRHALIALSGRIAHVAMSRSQSSSGVAISFANDAYAGGSVSIAHLRAIREGLAGAGLIEVRKGFFDRSGAGKSKATRLIPTSGFRELAAACGVAPHHVRLTPSHTYMLKEPSSGAGEAPEDVRLSGGIIRRLNELNGRHELSLPDEVWGRIVSGVQTAAEWDDETGGPAECAWNEAAISLWRSFKYDWGKGGRLYGGYWQSIPSAERKHFLIDGEPTVEVDFVSLHPSILFAEAGFPLLSDPYSVPGYEEVSREEGKRTFNRLLNGSWRSTKPFDPLSFDPEDKPHFGNREEFRSYVLAMRGNLSHIEHRFGLNYGLTLQRADSDLALDVVKQFLSMGSPIYPIHDSFIVKSSSHIELQSAMISSYRKMFGYIPKLRSCSNTVGL